VSAGTGFTLLGLVEYGLALPVSQVFLYWHIKLGIAMFWIALFHIHSYWKSSKVRKIPDRLQNKEREGKY